VVKARWLDGVLGTPLKNCMLRIYIFLQTKVPAEVCIWERVEGVRQRQTVCVSFDSRLKPHRGTAEADDRAPLTVVGRVSSPFRFTLRPPCDLSLNLC
jgi:hypothetical protein